MASPKHQPTIKKADLFLIGVLLLFILGALGIRLFLYRSPAAWAKITVDGETQMMLDLNQDFEGDIELENGGFNHILIQNGTIKVTSSSCPNKDCIRQGEISHTGEEIVCLPNRVSILILGSSS